MNKLSEEGASKPNQTKQNQTQKLYYSHQGPGMIAYDASQLSTMMTKVWEKSMTKTKACFCWHCWRLHFLDNWLQCFWVWWGKAVNFSRKHVTELCCSIGFKLGMKKRTITKQQQYLRDSVLHSPLKAHP